MRRRSPPDQGLDGAFLNADGLLGSLGFGIQFAEQVQLTADPALVLVSLAGQQLRLRAPAALIGDRSAELRQVEGREVCAAHEAVEIAGGEDQLESARYIRDRSIVQERQVLTPALGRIMAVSRRDSTNKTSAISQALQELTG